MDELAAGQGGFFASCAVISALHRMSMASAGGGWVKYHHTKPIHLTGEHHEST
jgi:hypothetical protein